jgi:hypothetical protein
MSQQVFPTDCVRARWAYSELSSPRQGHRYTGPELQELRAKSASRAPFDELAQDEIRLLAREFTACRGKEFNVYLERFDFFKLVHWTKYELGIVSILPCFFKEHLRGISTFGQLAESELAADSAGGGIFTQDHPVIVSRLLDGQRMMLIDGYHRALSYWHNPDGASKIAVLEST